MYMAACIALKKKKQIALVYENVWFMDSLENLNLINNSFIYLYIHVPSETENLDLYKI